MKTRFMGCFKGPGKGNQPMLHLSYGAQSFTSLKADLRQDINGEVLHLSGALMEHFLEGSAPLGLR